MNEYSFGSYFIKTLLIFKYILKILDILNIFSIPNDKNIDAKIDIAYN